MAHPSLPTNAGYSARVGDHRLVLSRLLACALNSPSAGCWLTFPPLLLHGVGGGGRGSHVPQVPMEGLQTGWFFPGSVCWGDTVSSSATVSVTGGFWG